MTSTPAAAADPRGRPPLTRWLLAVLAAKAAVHAAAITAYGYFRDELYYLACADHLAWGYVDHPPLSIAVLALWRAVFGDSLVAIRLVPLLAGLGTIVLCALLARRLGGGAFAQVLAGTAALAAPMYLGVNHFYSMNSLDILIWAAAFLLIARVADEEARPRDWMLLGVVLGLGLLDKISVLWLGFGLLVALGLTPLRRWLKTPWPYACGAIAFAIFLPHVLWQFMHSFPMADFMRNATGGKMAHTSPVDFVKQQFLSMLPANALVWGAGIVWLFRPSGARWRALGWIFLTVVALLAFSGTSRAQYLSPAYPALFAAGGVAWEAWLRRPAARGALLALLAGMAALVAPLALPLLPIDGYIAYAARLGRKPGTEERKAVGPLPQHFADMQGWPDLAATVARVWHTLTPEERRRASIVATNYGEAGAIDHFGRALGLPRAYAPHNSYWHWGMPPGDVFVIAGADREDLEPLFEEVQQVEAWRCDLCMPYENGLRIWVARRPRMPMRVLWGQARNFS